VEPERAIRWTLQAERDLEEHHRRLAGLDPEAARRFAASVLDAVEPLARFAFMGPVDPRIRPVGTYRSITCEGARIIYRVEPEVVLILRVWPVRRDPRDLIPE
jgi:plasmid stabilization system protein ParE